MNAVLHTLQVDAHGYNDYCLSNEAVVAFFLFRQAKLKY